MDWHQRYALQASWTRSLRDFLFAQVNLLPGNRILEVGCGTGVLLEELERRFKSSIHGLDIDRVALSQAGLHAPHAHLTCGDALDLPFPAQSFDLVVCHFLLLWVKDPARLLQECTRITRRNGNVLALAEPDYSARIDFPDQLAEIGNWQRLGLQAQGANPQVGRSLASLFTRAGLQLCQAGILGGQWTGACDSDEFQSEWQMIEYDLQFMPGQPAQERVDHLKAIDWDARQRGGRVLFVPTFYAWGEKPG